MKGVNITKILAENSVDVRLTLGMMSKKIEYQDESQKKGEGWVDTSRLIKIKLFQIVYWEDSKNILEPLKTLSVTWKCISIHGGGGVVNFFKVIFKNLNFGASVPFFFSSHVTIVHPMIRILSKCGSFFLAHQGPLYFVFFILRSLPHRTIRVNNEISEKKTHFVRLNAIL